MDDKIKAARAARRTQVFGIVSGALIAVYGLVISRDHITHVGYAIGLNRLEAETLFVFIDFVAIYGKMLTSKRLKNKTRKIGYGFLAFGGAASLVCNVASGVLAGSFGAALYGAFIVAIVAGLEYAIANTMAKAEAVVMVTKADADAALAAAMARADAVTAAAVANAVATTEQEVRAALAAEQADLIAEAERATREAATQEQAARAEADRVARERATAERLARPEAEAAKPRVAKAATVDEMATARVANGQASSVAMAILATDPGMATDEVIRLATEQGGVVPSGRTVRRAKEQMAKEMAAAAA